MEITPKISMSKAVSTQRPGKWYVFPSQMEGTVQLCLKSNFNLPIAEIKIFDSGRYVDFIETFMMRLISGMRYAVGLTNFHRRASYET